MLKRFVYTVVIIFVVLILSVLLLGRGGASQFSPDSFQHRGVTFLYIPYTDIVIYSHEHSAYHKDIVQFWLEDRYLDSTERPESWDTVTGWQQWRHLSYSGSAKEFWYRAGCNSEEGAKEWIDWSKKHPDLARRLWPTVVKLLAENRRNKTWINYYLAAQLMRNVKGTHDLNSFIKAFESWDSWSQSIKEKW